ncbi:uncharacterized protein LOC119681794 [Teleopsis dalmanni]|uniref:uncharacterized protein LOC119681794 n=1 Tax=Teleopsis dalmanni TaxID=139649 RepID=UPI0018CDD2A7|nr:uncharacterized protein LOC119681504 isoform X1 [Teleopsis dalmanni]XP_037951009.1 uncharacterized protein LOC119681794 [Teleopsis dalmanni]
MEQEDHTHRRTKFALAVFGISFCLILLTVAQWMPLVTICVLAAPLRRNYVVAVVVLMLAMVMVTCFVFCDNCRVKAPMNCVMVLLIFECTTIGFAVLIMEEKIQFFLLNFLIVTIVTLIVIIAATFCTYDMTVDIIALFVVAIILFIGSVFLVGLFAMINSKISYYLYTLLGGITIIMFMAYHTQTITGGRYAQMRTKDSLLGALILYEDYILLFMMSYFIIVENFNDMGIRGSSYECQND